MHSFYFGDSRQPLYGVHHSPSAAVFRDDAVVICGPVGHEYCRSHTLLRGLAHSFSSNGYHVLRFDYRGIGDSSGEIGDFNIEHWLDDIQMAVNELKAISGVANISVIGVRIGGMLSLLASLRGIFNRLILWDCVLDPKKYLDDLGDMSAKLLNNSSWFKYVREKNELLANEYVGYQYSKEYIDSLRTLNVMDSPFAKDLRVRSIFSSDSPGKELGDTYLKTVFSDYKSVFMDEKSDWLDVIRLGYSLAGQETIKCLCEEMSG